MTKKLRLLFSGEWSGLSSGFGVYSQNVLSRLHSTGKYDITEFACYCHPFDIRIRDIPWRVIGNFPNEHDQEEMGRYQAHPCNQFGRFRFDEVVNEVRPHLNCSIRDFWQMQHEFDSPLRPYYKMAWMLPVDSAPLDWQWVGDCLNLEYPFTYTHWGKSVLEQQSAGKVSVKEVLGGGADPNVFKPILDKKSLRNSFGLSEDLFIVGMVGRNQKRKLFPDLLDSFELYIEELSKVNPALAAKSYLYFHTSHPDAAWNYPEILKQSKVGHKVLFTYRCKTCNQVCVFFFQDARAFCPRCKQPMMGCPDTKRGISSEDLAKVYNLFDVYVHLAIAGGLEIPIIEAGMCGVPVICHNYSGMEDFPVKIGAIPVNVERFYLETETQAYRAYCDNQDLVCKLIKFAELPKQIRDKKGFEVHNKTLSHYSWDVIAKKWENVLDEIEPEDKWNNPPNIHQPPGDYPKGLGNEEFVRWCIINVLNQPQKLDGYKFMRIVRDLNYGARIEGLGGMQLNSFSILSMQPKWSEINQDSVFKEMVEQRNSINYWENRRAGNIKVNRPYYLESIK